MDRKLHITSILDGAENDSLNWRRHAGGIREGKGRETRHTQTETCVETFHAVRPSRCGGKAHFSVSLQRQKPCVGDCVRWPDFTFASLQETYRIPCLCPSCPHPSSHSSFLTLVYSFHLHLYSNFYHVTFFTPHSTPTFPLAPYF